MGLITWALDQAFKVAVINILITILAATTCGLGYLIYTLTTKKRFSK